MNIEDVKRITKEPVAWIPNHYVQYNSHDLLQLGGWFPQHKLLGIDKAVELLLPKRSGNRPKIAVLDTGRPYHCTGGVDPSDLGVLVPGETSIDRNGHGTHCLSTIGSSMDGGKYPNGVCPWAHLFSGKVLSDAGAGADSWIAAGIARAVAAGCDIISMSMGGPEPLPETEQQMKLAEEAGVIVCVAAGNEGLPRNGRSSVGYPARYETCWAVGSLNHVGVISSFSSQGPEVDTAAVGEIVRAQYRNCLIATLSGTSMATPQFAGIVGLFVSALRSASGNPKARITGSQLVDLQKKYHVDVPPEGKDNATGLGYFQADKCVEYILNGGLGSSPTPPKPGKPRPGEHDIDLACAFKEWFEQYDWSDGQ